MRPQKTITALCFWLSSAAFALPIAEHDFLIDPVEEWSIDDFKIILPSGEEGSGSITVMSKNTYFYYLSKRRDISGDTGGKRILVNVTYIPETGKKYTSAGTMDLDKKHFYPLFIEGEKGSKAPVDGTVFQSDGHAVTALMKDSNGVYRPVFCPLDKIESASYVGCKILPEYESGKRGGTITIPVEFAESSKRPAGDVIIGVVIRENDLNPIAHVFWQATSPYQQYSKAQLRTNTADKNNDALYYAGTLPDKDLSFYATDIHYEMTNPANNLLSFPVNESTPINETLRDILIKGIFNSSMVVANNCNDKCDGFDYITSTPTNYLGQKPRQKVDSLEFPFSYYSAFESPSIGCSLYHSLDWNWHYQVCSDRTNLFFPEEYLGLGVVRPSADFYRNILKVNNGPDKTSLQMQLQHVTSENIHYGVIRTANKDNGGTFYRINLKNVSQ